MRQKHPYPIMRCSAIVFGTFFGYLCADNTANLLMVRRLEMVYSPHTSSHSGHSVT